MSYLHNLPDWIKVSCSNWHDLWHCRQVGAGEQRQPIDDQPDANPYRQASRPVGRHPRARGAWQRIVVAPVIGVVGCASMLMGWGHARSKCWGRFFGRAAALGPSCASTVNIRAKPAAGRLARGVDGRDGFGLEWGDVFPRFICRTPTGVSLVDPT